MAIRRNLVKGVPPDNLLSGGTIFLTSLSSKVTQHFRSYLNSGRRNYVEIISDSWWYWTWNFADYHRLLDRRFSSTCNAPSRRNVAWTLRNPLSTLSQLWQARPLNLSTKYILMIPSDLSDCDAPGNLHSILLPCLRQWGSALYQVAPFQCSVQQIF